MADDNSSTISKCSSTSSETSICWLRQPAVIEKIRFNRIIKTFAIHPEPCTLSKFAALYEKVNSSPIDIPPLSLEDFMEKKGLTESVYHPEIIEMVLTPTKLALSLARSILPAVPDVITIKKPPHFQSKLRGIKFLKIPKEAKENGSVLIRVVDSRSGADDFWFQLVSPTTSVITDNLVMEMHEYYAVNQQNLVIDNLELINNPDIVAAPYLTQGYHRAMVFEKLERDFVKVLFFDYGTVDVVQLQLLRYLPEKFKTLPAQAINGKLLFEHNLQKLSKSGNRLFINSTANLVVCRAIIKMDLSHETYWPIEKVPLELFPLSVKATGESINKQIMGDMSNRVTKFKSPLAKIEETSSPGSNTAK